MSDHPGSVVAVGDEVQVEVLEVDRERERISLSLKATQQDPWQEFAGSHRVGELVYGRVTKLVPFGSFVQVGDGIEGLVHISEMSAHHVDLPEQVVTTGEELWVKIIDLDLQRRRISLSIKQAAEGGVVAAEYQEAFGEHAYDESGKYVGDGNLATNESGVVDYTEEARQAWREYYEQHGEEAYRTAVSDYGAGDDPAGVLNDPVATDDASAEPVEAEPGPTADDAVPEDAPSDDAVATDSVSEGAESEESVSEEIGSEETVTADSNTVA